MASSNGKDRYPPRLCEEIEASTRIRSIYHNCYLSNFQMVYEGVGNDVWKALKASSVGVIVKLRDVAYIWSSKTVEYLLKHQLVIESPYEIWSLIDGQPIRFSLYEFEEITGLNCASFKENDRWDADHKAFWGEMNVCTSVGPSLDELQAVLEICKDWSFEKGKMVGWLCILSIGILGISPSSRIPLQLAKRVLDPEAFESYPWGRVGFNSLVQSIKISTYGVKKSNTIQGCVHVLLIWAYESILGLAERYGKKRIRAEVPLLSYAGSRPRVNFEEFITNEKQTHDNKVRVRHFVERECDDIYSSWDGDNQDVKVNNLIEDIRENRLDTHAWDVNEASVSKKRHVPQQSSKKKKAAKIHSHEAATTEVQKIRFEGENSGNMRVPSETEKAVLGIVEMMKALTEKVENMDNHLPEKVLASMKPAIHAEVNAQLDERLVTVHEKIANLEDAVKNITDRLKAGENVERANSNARCSDEATSKAMSWMVQKKATSQDDFPIQCVVKNAKKVSQKTEKVTENNGLDCKEIQKPEVPHQDIVRQGNSTVKRIISGVTQSVTVYDPFAVVDESLYAKLLDFMQPDDMEPIATWDTNVEFYKVIITPRIHWPNNTYGWLTTSHLCAAMLMFHKRSMRTPSPYYSSWITFLNQWFVNTWVRDYKTFDPKTWIIPDKYRGVFNGTYPVDSVTNKKWITDVDHVFACHFINDNHWIALDIDLVKEKINVYDSIITMVMDDKDILNFCRPFTRMIPAMLNAMIPSRKKSDKQFLAKRLKSIPQNNDPGDCGVYTLKYIECLALGCSFDGLSDRNIQALRHKLAAEILDEVGEPGMSMSISLPDGKLGLRDSE